MSPTEMLSRARQALQLIESIRIHSDCHLLDRSISHLSETVHWLDRKAAKEIVKVEPPRCVCERADSLEVYTCNSLVCPVHGPRNQSLARESFQEID